jgi:hypothetical protein
MGCLCYLVSVLLLSWRHLEGDEFTRYLALAIGGISVLTVLVTVGLIAQAPPPAPGLSSSSPAAPPARPPSSPASPLTPPPPPSSTSASPTSRLRSHPPTPPPPPRPLVTARGPQPRRTCRRSQRAPRLGPLPLYVHKVNIKILTVEPEVHVLIFFHLTT